MGLLASIKALLPLINENQDRAIEQATFVLQQFSERYFSHWLSGMRRKLGLTNQQDDDLALATDLLSSIEGQNADFTQVFRSLSTAVEHSGATRSLLDNPNALDPWLARWKSRLALNDADMIEARALMDANNPIYIPRNHKVEEALDAATYHNNFGLFRTLLEITSSPYERRSGLEEYETPAPLNRPPYRTFCGT